MAVLTEAPTPTRGRSLSRSKIAAALRRGGRRNRVEARAEQIQAALRAPALEQPEVVADAYGTVVASLVRLLQVHAVEIDRLEEASARVSPSTRTLSCCAAFPGWASSPAPGCWVSSVTIPTAI